jgi:phosphoribosylaminoimidazole-succinocarboxamide synthase
MLCRKTEVVPIECIARGYITGSGWKDYQNSGAVCGIELPAGLRNSDRLAEPLFTPSTRRLMGTMKTSASPKVLRPSVKN